MTELQKTQTIKFFEDLFFLEKEARDLYTEYLKDMKDVEDIKIVKKIRDDEIKHMQLAHKILEMIKIVEI